MDQYITEIDRVEPFIVKIKTYDSLKAFNIIHNLIPTAQNLYILDSDPRAKTLTIKFEIKTKYSKSRFLEIYTKEGGKNDD